MPCAGKDGRGCSCQAFQPKDSTDDPASKCKLCKHRKKKHHTAPTQVSAVLAQYDLARLQSKKVSEEEACRESNEGFRRGKSEDVDTKRVQSRRNRAQAKCRPKLIAQKRRWLKSEASRRSRNCTTAASLSSRTPAVKIFSLL
ncbi:hypothetical protein B0H10DRAFT_1156122 [Mycena sp. CBHHK59/15]|nr:hypothetical protein B0H10DRAFT_1156122 [Mycena sp. CBHHK59/15]